tara:strand:- start:1568 stop:3580 length:2013 start_codon:yes stop_codon:yes gene_type:complete
MAAEKFIIEIRTKGFKGANTALEKVTKSTRAFSREANKGSGIAAGFRRNMSRLRNNLLLVSFAFGTVALAFKKFIDASSGFENVKTRLTGLMGSAERAERAFKNFNTVAATTPFSLQDVVEAGAQLKAFGADAESMIKPVTDLAAFMGTTATEAANSLGRAYAGGAGAADILRERGVLNLVKSFSKIDDLSKITLPEFRKALERTLVDPAAGIAGSTDRMSQTFTGAFSNMTDAVTRLAANIGDIFIPALKSATIGLGQFASAADKFLTFAKTGHADFDIFGESLEKFNVKIETMSVSELESELASLNQQIENSKKPVEEAAQSTISFGDSIKFLGPAQDMLADGTVTIIENYNGLNDVFSKNGVTILKGTSLLDGLKTKSDEFNTTQVATNVNAEHFETRIKAINAELKRRSEINPELETVQKNFKELLDETTMVQLKNIDATILEIETNALLLGSTEEVTAVLEKLKQKRAELSGEAERKRASDEAADKANKEEAEKKKKQQKELEDQLYNTAAAATALASGMKTMMDSTASNEDKMKSFLSTLGQIVSIMVPGGAGALGGSLIQAMSGFIGHTGGLIQNTGIQRFATGGMVQGQDNVPILAQAGEFIMQRSAVDNIGLQNLAQMNNGDSPGSSLTINIAGDMVGDEEHVRTKVLPAIREEMRREANA